ncbi:MAG: hypothetical protein ACOY4P_00655, partial [Pseudomonadota bacterium]
MRPILGSIRQPQATLKTAFPIAQPMTPAVRASKTFRRLAASETLNVSSLSAFGLKMKEADIELRQSVVLAKTDIGLC